MTTIWIVFWHEDHSRLCLECFASAAMARVWKEAHHPIAGWVVEQPIRGASFL